MIVGQGPYQGYSADQFKLCTTAAESLATKKWIYFVDVQNWAYCYLHWLTSKNKKYIFFTIDRNYKLEF